MRQYAWSLEVEAARLHPGESLVHRALNGGSHKVAFSGIGSQVRGRVSRRLLPIERLRCPFGLGLLRRLGFRLLLLYRIVSAWYSMGGDLFCNSSIMEGSLKIASAKHACNIRLRLPSTITDRPLNPKPSTLNPETPKPPVSRPWPGW